MLVNEENVGLLLKAMKFAAEKHQKQRRKDSDATPYINHPIAVGELLWNIGKIQDIAIVIAGLLHDTLEDTNTKPAEIQEQFGALVLAWVQEVTDDKKLPKAERKRLQIVHAPHKSKEAKQIKLADKICNVADIARTAPQGWPLERQQEYLDWAEKVVEGLQGCNPALEALFQKTLQHARDVLQSRKEANAIG